MSGEGALLVTVSAGNGGGRGLEAKTDVANITSDLEITALGHNLGSALDDLNLSTRALLAQSRQSLLGVLEDGGLLQVSTLILKVGHGKVACAHKNFPLTQNFSASVI